MVKKVKDKEFAKGLNEIDREHPMIKQYGMLLYEPQNGDIWVEGYYRKDGTKVYGYRRKRK
jgi:hypothetical protein